MPGSLHMFSFLFAHHIDTQDFRWSDKYEMLKVRSSKLKAQSISGLNRILFVSCGVAFKAVSIRCFQIGAEGLNTGHESSVRSLSLHLMY